ncbi:LacI family DNA-binding transcriptional regulator [Lapillicoccus jejuensis]|uniref:LacI family transcriptional regulator n=1 Tax=Lapillicoccus jejuensis TaxID=402171 RepID=A0A542DWF1_9MICO|nr:LacI family DNA-binding transcriptional regulator [Lapillicoccus jejuensis]TQJ07418.1 LacI family transcriptional regulator [Lapillicoccus jejuensis]
MASILDVAQASGVSVATVSRALRGLDRVSESTRAKVLAAARELNYVASPTAASLASGRTRIIGVVTPFSDRWYFSTLISGVEKSIRDHAHHVLLLDLEESASGRRSVSHDLVGKRVDGVLVLNMVLDPQEEQVLHDLGLPVVTVGRSYDAWSSVGIDESGTVDAAARHVVGLGHRDIAYVGDVAEDAAYGEVPGQRFGAFRTVLEEAGIPVRREWVRTSDWTSYDAARDARELLSREERPTAVVAGSDEMALGVLAAAVELGLSVPGDLSITGVDDIPMAQTFGLTTVRQDVRAVAERAGDLLMASLGTGRSRPDEPPVPERILLPTELVVRRSTGAPA